jgi:hypothetical protein
MYGSGIYGVPEETGWIDTGWMGPDYLDYGDTAEPTGYDDSQATPDDAAGGYDAGPPEQTWPSLYAYNQRPNAQQPHASSIPDNEEAVTLIFKDGRPSEQIHNYAMTATTLYVLDTPHRNIPLDQLNVAATKKLNDDAGVNFQLPQASK